MPKVYELVSTIACLCGEPIELKEGKATCPKCKAKFNFLEEAEEQDINIRTSFDDKSDN